jgi:hypothetical protein
MPQVPEDVPPRAVGVRRSGRDYRPPFPRELDVIQYLFEPLGIVVRMY